MREETKIKAKVAAGLAFLTLRAVFVTICAYSNLLGKRYILSPAMVAHNARRD